MTNFYTIDLQDKGRKFSFDDSSRTSWIQAFPVGTYDHAQYGELIFNQTFFKEIIKNFYANVRGIEPDIDYDHKAHESTAAGWVKDIQDRGPEGVWLKVEWTPRAYQALKDGEYKYFSPEFGAWENPKTHVVYTDVLLGGGITNRPFLKELAPVNLTELSSAENNNNKGESMKELLKKLSAALGVNLSEDDSADEQTVLTAIQEVLKQNGDLGTEVATLKTTLSEKEKENDGEDAELAKLAEKNPLVKKMLADREADQKRLSDLEQSYRLSEASKQLGEIKVKNQILPPVFVNKASALLAIMPKALSEEMTKVLTELVTVGLVQLGEVGSSGGSNRKELNEDPTKMTEGSYKKFNDAVQEIMAKDKVDFVSAAKTVGRTNPGLWDEYNNNFPGKVS